MFVFDDLKVKFKVDLNITCTCLHFEYCSTWTEFL